MQAELSAIQIDITFTNKSKVLIIGIVYRLFYVWETEMQKKYSITHILLLHPSSKELQRNDQL